ncbi:hypothetical protein V6N12_013104 [Hibiscus sabdariffa]|uniref:RecF/RecN/SMC N-terminal domain-containing protein n=1 Tax=Hibiscus sabdariffa TaxID=183260 RepID=A0ABR2EGD3_9ROSI
MQEQSSLENQFASVRTQINNLNLEVQEQVTKMKECDTEINSILKQQQKLQHKLSNIKLERKKLENEVKQMEMEQKDCSTKVDKLIEKHAWIATERQLFGRGGTDYDFASRDPHKAREELEKLQTEQSGLEKRVNKKVMAMFEKAEDEYNDLMSKKNTVEICVALSFINAPQISDFGSIFSTLLPGTMAKLEPPEGCSFLDGLEVRVAFGGVWNQSLSELSGGQRSLLALSLILALLLFKPAPLYILDEFIVVSLKEGMFNNVNVLFRTKFVDGVSTVQRTIASKPTSR